MGKYILIFSILLVIQNCSTKKRTFVKTGDYETAINSAVIDFCHTSSLANKDKTFSVSYKDYDSGIIGVSILGDINKIYIVGGSSQGRVKDRFMEYDNKLFYWYDEKKDKDPNIMSKLSKYGVIIKVDSLTEDMGYTIDDSKKAIHYYFCKNNLSIFKKKITPIALPKEIENKLNCK
ncbi:hypothetical protein JSO56_05775 [Riemerella anatipestifer]|uniref:hypothetical protein n=1 Tax=Riemerella anatipestifer TaxID=34085 RepID=UPI0030BE3701